MSHKFEEGRRMCVSTACGHKGGLHAERPGVHVNGMNLSSTHLGAPSVDPLRWGSWSVQCKQSACAAIARVCLHRASAARVDAVARSVRQGRIRQWGPSMAKAGSLAGGVLCRFFLLVPRPCNFDRSVAGCTALARGEVLVVAARGRTLASAHERKPCGACGRRHAARDGLTASAHERKSAVPSTHLCARVRACAIAYKHVAGWLRDESLTRWHHVNCRRAPYFSRVSSIAPHTRAHTHRARTHARQRVRTHTQGHASARTRYTATWTRAHRYPCPRAQDVCKPKALGREGVTSRGTPLLSSRTHARTLDTRARARTLYHTATRTARTRTHANACIHTHARTHTPLHAHTTPLSHIGNRTHTCTPQHTITHSKAHARTNRVFRVRAKDEARGDRCVAVAHRVPQLARAGISRSRAGRRVPAQSGRPCSA